MKAKDVKEILVQSGVNYLYHVNTIATSLSYIKSGGLLSRQTADDMGLPQTPQSSDETDKEFGVYNDIFFDSVDIHQRASRANHYGPLMFVYSVDVLDTLEEYDICITKSNPMFWNRNMSYEDKYFTNSENLFFEFARGNFSQHITIRDISKPLPFEYLIEIVIENPGEKYSEFLHQAIEALKNAGVKVPIVVRKCKDTCRCVTTYSGHKSGYVYHRFKTSC